MKLLNVPNVHIAGKLIDLNSPQSLSIEVVASTLARNCRFNGALRDDVPVIWHSVADHCVLVSELLQCRDGDPNLAKLGLLHDAHEALIGDIPTPVKRWFRIEEQEKALEMRVLEYFGMGRHATAQAMARVKQADIEALRIEVNMLALDPHVFGFDAELQFKQKAADRDFCDARGLLQPVGDIPLSRVFESSRNRFLDVYADLDTQANLPRLEEISKSCNTTTPRKKMMRCAFAAD